MEKFKMMESLKGMIDDQNLIYFICLFQKEYKKRKRMCMDIISQLAENMDKKVKEVEEMIGIEKD